MLHSSACPGLKVARSGCSDMWLKSTGCSPEGGRGGGGDERGEERE